MSGSDKLAVPFRFPRHIAGQTRLNTTTVRASRLDLVSQTGRQERMQPCSRRSLVQRKTYTSNGCSSTASTASSYNGL